MSRSVSVIVKNSAGLHARPASLFVSIAKKHGSDIRMIKGEHDANAKSILKVLALGVECGDMIEIKADGDDGDDEEEALNELISVVENSDDS